MRTTLTISAALVAAGLAAVPVMLRAQGAPPERPPAELAAPGGLPETGVAFIADWASSPHARHDTEAFTHWNKERTIPVDCARCHSTPGFRDWLGADGSTPGKVDRPAPTGTVITCTACHSEKARALTSVTFPSGLSVDGQGSNARCMACHQGLESTRSVNAMLAGIGEDAVEPKLEFINVHYGAAGAMLFGHEAQVGYEYSGNEYAGRLQHRAPYTTCVTCHATHTVAVKVFDCANCHLQVSNRASLHDIRTRSVDWNGDGNIEEGAARRIDRLRSKLLAAIQDYAMSVGGQPIAYLPEIAPYFFVDLNGNGRVDKDEVAFSNRFKSWTPRLMKAAYNYQFVSKDRGAYAHNGIYAVELLQDSLRDLGSKVTVDLGSAERP